MKIHEQATSALVIAAVGIFPLIKAVEFLNLKKIPKSSSDSAQTALQNAHLIAQKLFKRTNALSSDESKLFTSGLFDLALYLALDEIETDYNVEKDAQKQESSFANARAYFCLISGFQTKKFDNLIKNKTTKQFISAKAL